MTGAPRERGLAVYLFVICPLTQQWLSIFLLNEDKQESGH
jgi:hypothetical protein